ncbi:MAG: hypothetical protein RLZZ244_347 [Verrucomicrobiota bacterium]
MKAEPYYPPRAGQWSRMLRPLLFPVVRLQRFLERLSESFHSWSEGYPWIFWAGVLSGLCVRLAIPGHWMLSTSAQRLGRLIQSCWCAGLGVFGIWMGQGVGDVAYAGLISLHASSAIGFVSRAYPQKGVLRQVLQALGIVLLMGQVVYPAGLFVVQRFVCMPVSLGGRVLVINCLPWASKGTVGDYVVFHLASERGRGYRVEGGIAGGRILAGEGDEVRFGEDAFETQAGRFPRLYGMPRAGSEKVGAGKWFLWPEVKASYQYLNLFGLAPEGPRVSEEALSRPLLQISEVSRADVIGKPFSSWLWRRQIE